MRILLAEDDPTQLESLQAALVRSPHHVDGPGDGLMAQWLLSSQTYDLLILDWMLPYVSGLDLCRQYRQAGATAPILTVGMGGDPNAMRSRSWCAAYGNGCN